MRLLAPALFFALSCLGGEDLAPQINTVTPRVVKPGDSVVITGVALGEALVEDVYLSDHKFDMKVKILEQSSERIKFRIPPFAKAGRMQLLMLMKPEKEGEDPKLLELPAYLLIEEAGTEITQGPGNADKGKKSEQKDQPQQKEQPQQ